MTGTHTQNSVFSRITLALMEDTGWYRADYNNAKPLAWGKGLGCEFATKSCKEWINNNTFRYLYFVKPILIIISTKHPKRTFTIFILIHFTATISEGDEFEQDNRYTCALYFDNGLSPISKKMIL